MMGYWYSGSEMGWRLKDNLNGICVKKTYRIPKESIGNYLLKNRIISKPVWFFHCMNQLHVLNGFLSNSQIHEMVYGNIVEIHCRT